jgi:starvation-inducible DNA-binding protein
MARPGVTTRQGRLYETSDVTSDRSSARSDTVVVQADHEEAQMTTTLLVTPDTGQLNAASTLQTVLLKLVALTLDAKQAHWNVTGPGFLSLHALTDELAGDIRVWADRVAERSVALGSPVDARPTTVASAVTQPFPTGWLSDHEAIAELARRIDDITSSIRDSAVELERDDAVARHAVDEILEGLEKYRWMLVAQTR